MSRVKLKVPVPIGKCCDPDSGRYALGSAAVYAQGNRDPWLVATNSRMLACYPLDPRETYFELDKGEEQALIPNSCLPKNPKQFDQFVEFDGSRWFTEWGKSDSKVEGRFPRYMDVLPVFSERDRHIQLTIDPNLLLDLAKSIAADSLTLLIDLPKEDWDDPRTITNALGVLGGEGGFGVMMPLTGGGESEVIESYTARRKRALIAGGAMANDTPQRDEIAPFTDESHAETAEVPDSCVELAPLPSPLERLAAFARSRQQGQETRIPA